MLGGRHSHWSPQDLEEQDFSPYGTFPPSPTVSTETSSSIASTRPRVNPRIVSDAILGLSDGLTVPFALSAGLSALGNSRVVVVGGLAELVAGAISMGLGGYVGSRSEVESYEATVRETKNLVKASPMETMNIIRQVFAPYNLPDEPVARMSHILYNSPEKLLDFLLTFHHKESKPGCNQAWISAITLALGYFIGGFIPLIPYFMVDQVLVALYYSIGIMIFTLLVFGYVKTCVVRGWTGKENIVAGIKGGLQMVIVGGLAAGASIALARAINPTGSALF
ncbi:Calcium transporter [Trichophyton interdigitale]|nr:DUF125-domain-containing protein [Trichophyton interdigitale]KAG5217478.1 DUF125-domain-containing protein [Trichophyton interdigitale]KAG8206756.1 Calcium transporter [Trichophyton interdigitale]